MSKIKSVLQSQPGKYGTTGMPSSMRENANSLS